MRCDLIVVSKFMRELVMVDAESVTLSRGIKEPVHFLIVLISFVHCSSTVLKRNGLVLCNTIIIKCLCSV